MNDDGTVFGVDNAKKLMEDIPNKVRDVLGIMADVNLLTEQGKDYKFIIKHYYQGVDLTLWK